MFSEEIKKKAKTGYRPAVFTISALLIFMAAACLSLRYAPKGAVSILAEINRIDFFGITNRDPIIILGYYIKRFFGISPSCTVCMILPLCCYSLFVVLLWRIADCFFAEDKSKSSLCFFVEACLVFLWDCGTSSAYFALHGLHQAEGIIMTLALPYVFLLGIRLCFYEKREMEASRKRSLTLTINILRILLLTVCILSAFFFSKKALGLILFSIAAFVFLFIIRRFLPWLKSSG